ncbi:universal stress protein [Spartinivicinus poritis]|uniref:Universal stress protein n=1 Tax=Spartinivicinus poritis TaxID=2994640 RepID=A0ABT5UA04_9GAMM|nr:universal stress protein [Spartinivicinus sp. A2-2]MDE1461969.1 universal stress protein [Spartinivicinus sp. A2-2]
MYKNILLPVDLNETALAQKAIDTAIFLAQSNNATLHLFTVIPGFNMPIVSNHFPTEVMREALADLKARLKEYAKQQLPEGVNYEVDVAEGKAYKKILKKISQSDIDLVVIATHNSKLNHFFLGSVTAKVVEHCNTSILVIK